MGLFSFVFEAGDVEARAGCDSFERKTRTGTHHLRFEEKECMLLKWNDDILGGDGFKKWETFDHPQLGKIEIGGWKWKFTLQNPPSKLLESEVDNDMMFAIECAKLLPLINISSVSVSRQGNNIYKISAFIENTGFFPTNITEQAKILNRVSSVKVELDIISGAESITPIKMDVGHIDGTCARALEGSWRRKHRSYSPQKGDLNRRYVYWLIMINDPKNFNVKIRATSDRAGNQEINLLYHKISFL